MDFFVNDVLKQIKESEESAIEKQRTLQSLDMKIYEGGKKSIKLDQELSRAKNELKLAEKDEIRHLAQLEEIDTRIKSLSIQSSNINQQKCEALKTVDDKMKTIENSANEIVQEVNDFVVSYGAKAYDEQRDNRQEKWNQLLYEKLVECKDEFKKLGDLEKAILKKQDDEQLFYKLHSEFDMVAKTKENLEIESEDLMTEIRHCTLER